MKDARRRTLIDTPVSPPTKGVVFVHAARPDAPMIISRVDDADQVWRVNSVGDVAQWGDVEDWFDEIRRRTIVVVYVPALVL